MQAIVDMWYDDETTQELLEWYKIIWDKWVEDIVKWIRNLEGSIAWYDIEIKRLSDQKKRFDNNKKVLEGILDQYLKVSKIDKLETSIAKLSYRKSESVTVLDEDLLNDEYWREKITKEVDKIKIKEDIKNGIIVEWATITVNQNLQIK